MTDTMMHSDYSLLDGAAMYDVFYEAGTKLGGRLVALANKAGAAGDKKTEQQWMNGLFRLDDERAAVDSNDWAAQIAAVKRWNARRAELKALLYD